MLLILEAGRPQYQELEKAVTTTARRYSLKPVYMGSTGLPTTPSKRRGNQWDADYLLNYFSKTVRLPKDSLGLLLTEQDLFLSIYNFIFGLAEPQLGWAVLSTYRLLNSSKDLYLSRVEKEVGHEIGHLFGLHHCPNNKCVMSFSNTVNEVDEKNTTLCVGCDKLLAAIIR